MVKRVRPRQTVVKVYLHPLHGKDFYWNGNSIRNPANAPPRTRESEYFRIPKKMYDADQVRAKAEGGPPQFVRVGDPAKIRAEEVQDQKVEKRIAGADRGTLIISAFSELDHYDDDHWNKDDTPSIRHLESVLGFQITKVELEGLVEDTRRMVDEEDDDDDETND